MSEATAQAPASTPDAPKHGHKKWIVIGAGLAILAIIVIIRRHSAAPAPSQNNGASTIGFTPYGMPPTSGGSSSFDGGGLAMPPAPAPAPGVDWATLLPLLFGSGGGGGGGTPAPSPSPTPAPTAAPSVDPNDGIISALYNELLGRNPDAGGLTYWEGYMHNGWTITQVMSGIRNSAEYLGLHPAATPAPAPAATPAPAPASGGNNNVQFDGTITALYEALLNRAPETGGMGFWENLMAGGWTAQQVETGIKSSPEYQSLHTIAAPAPAPAVMPGGGADGGDGSPGGDGP